VSRGEAEGSRNISASNGDGAHLKKFENPLDKPHKVWYNASVVRKRTEASRTVQKKDV
jgi:hypothetical protein